jgi:hypothetical protein
MSQLAQKEGAPPVPPVRLTAPAPEPQVTVVPDEPAVTTEAPA